MTLICGHATDDIGFLVGDTLLTNEFELKGHEGPVNGKFHALKIHILNGRLAVAYAGDVDKSNKTIHALQAALAKGGVADIPKKLHELYLEGVEKSGGEATGCEFLVLQIEQDGKRSYRKLTVKALAKSNALTLETRPNTKKLLSCGAPILPPSHDKFSSPMGPSLQNPCSEQRRNRIRGDFGCDRKVAASEDDWRSWRDLGQ